MLIFVSVFFRAQPRHGYRVVIVSLVPFECAVMLCSFVSTSIVRFFFLSDPHKLFFCLDFFPR